MAHSLQRPHLPHTTPSPADVRLHADRTAHPRLDLLAWSSLALGVATFLFAAAGGSLIGVGLGIIGFGVSAAAQMFSATTTERWLILPGWSLSFVGGLLNLFYLYS